MLRAEAQHFLLRIAAFAMKSGLLNAERIGLFYPRSKLHFGSRLLPGTYKDIFIRQDYRSPIDLPRGSRIVDGGANIGLASLYFLHRYPEAHVEAYEANPAACALLTKTLASTGFSKRRYEVHGKALHTEDCRIPFYIDPDNFAAVGSSISGRAGMETQGRRVDVSAIDIRALLEKPIDLLKLDVEGHEYVLLDIPEITPKTVRAMVLEFHEMENHMDACARIFARFSAAGYRIEFVENPSLDALEPANWNGAPIVRIYAP